MHRKEVLALHFVFVGLADPCQSDTGNDNPVP
ncbi:MAG: hypothetical protein CM15mP68_4860 [Pseudomonadota bacterium]|nr:MAG: hypothetical protein CM15mP68_4860 [Pseudomonadota bacterium]